MFINKFLLIISFLLGMRYNSYCQKTFVLDSSFATNGALTFIPDNLDDGEFIGPKLFEIDDQNNIYTILNKFELPNASGLILKLDETGNYANDFGAAGIKYFQYNGWHTVIGVSLKLRDRGFVVAFQVTDDDITLEDTYLMKVDAQGINDPNFGTDGFLRMGIWTDFTIGSLVEVEDGIVAFTRYDDIFGVFKLDYQGNKVADFGENGTTLFEPITQEPGISVLIEFGQPTLYYDHHIYVFNCSLEDDDGYSFIEIHRLDSSGNLDTEWEALPDTKRKVKQGGLYCKNFKVDRNGDLVAAYKSYPKDSSVINFIKISTSGLLDTEFKLNGAFAPVSTSVSNLNSYNITDLHIDNANNYWFSFYKPNEDFAESIVYKYTSNGDPVSNFGEGGKIVVNDTELIDENHWGFNIDNEGAFYIGSTRVLGNPNSGDFRIRKYIPSATAATKNVDHETQIVSIFPNPASDNIRVSISNSNQHNHVCLQDMNNCIIFEKDINNVDFIDISVSDISSGLYIISVSNNHSKSVQKVQILK